MRITLYVGAVGDKFVLWNRSRRREVLTRPSQYFCTVRTPTRIHFDQSVLMCAVTFYVTERDNCYTQSKHNITYNIRLIVRRPRRRIITLRKIDYLRVLDICMTITKYPPLRARGKKTALILFIVSGRESSSFRNVVVHWIAEFDS